MERAQGIDVSRWQGKVDWLKVRDAGYRFAFIRATIGDSYADPRFDANWLGAHDAGMLVSAYHAVTPTTSADDQISHFLDVLDGRPVDLPLVIDAERDDGEDPATITRRLLDCLEAAGSYGSVASSETEQRQVGRSPIVYTARWFWNRHVLTSAVWEGYDLWVASYTAEPVLPRDWTMWRFWQYSERGSVPGIAASTDLNWFNGSLEDLLAYAGQDNAPPRVTGPGWRLRVTTRKLNVRNGPGLDYDDVGDLYEGDVLDVLTLTGDDAWVEFEPGKWAALALKGERYLEPEPSVPTVAEPDAET